jgi:hypothetical protein
MDWDETQGWIFTPEYHDWQDSQEAGEYRNGDEIQVSEHGWWTGLFSVKSDPVKILSWGTIARWPDPFDEQDLSICLD